MAALSDTLVFLRQAAPDAPVLAPELAVITSPRKRLGTDAFRGLQSVTDFPPARPG